jgi:shikimate kinase
MSNIILIGFMGSGKSTIGKILSKISGLEFVDMDDVILKESEKSSIKQIFQDMGESYFRQLETKIAKELSKKNNLVIATGGGVIMNKVNIEFLKESGTIVYLESSFETIQRRIKPNGERPLFNDLEAAEKLYDLRQPLYLAYSDINVIADGNPKKVAERILEQINLK